MHSAFTPFGHEGANGSLLQFEQLETIRLVINLWTMSSAVLRISVCLESLLHFLRKRNTMESFGRGLTHSLITDVGPARMPPQTIAGLQLDVRGGC